MDIVGNFMKCGSPERYIKRYLKDITNTENFPFLLKLNKNNINSELNTQKDSYLLMMAIEKVKTDTFISCQKNEAGKPEICVFSAGVSANLEIMYGQPHIDVLDYMEIESVRSKYVDNYIHEDLQFLVKFFYEQLGISRRNRPDVTIQEISSINTIEFTDYGHYESDDSFDNDSDGHVSVEDNHAESERRRYRENIPSTSSLVEGSAGYTDIRNVNPDFRVSNTNVGVSDTNVTTLETKIGNDGKVKTPSRLIECNFKNGALYSLSTESRIICVSPKDLHKIPKISLKSNEHDDDHDTDEEYDAKWDLTESNENIDEYQEETFVFDGDDADIDKGAYENHQRIKLHQYTTSTTHTNRGALAKICLEYDSKKENATRKDLILQDIAAPNNSKVSPTVKSRNEKPKSSNSEGDESNRLKKKPVPLPRKPQIMPRPRVDEPLQDNADNDAKIAYLNTRNVSETVESRIFPKIGGCLSETTTSADNVDAYISERTQPKPTLPYSDKETHFDSTPPDRSTAIQPIVTPPERNPQPPNRPQGHATPIRMNHKSNYDYPFIDFSPPSEPKVPNNPCLKTETSKSILKKLSVTEVIDILTLNQLEHRKDIFIANDIDGNLLVDLKEPELIDLKLTKFEVKKLCAFINGWRPNREGSTKKKNTSNLNVTDLFDLLVKSKFDTLAQFLFQQNIDGDLFTKMVKDDTFIGLEQEHNISLKSFHIIKLKKIAEEDIFQRYRQL